MSLLFPIKASGFLLNGVPPSFSPQAASIPISLPLRFPSPKEGTRNSKSGGNVGPHPSLPPDPPSSYAACPIPGGPTAKFQSSYFFFFFISFLLYKT